MNLTEDLRDLFCSPDREPLIALDWNNDIEPMFDANADVRLLSLSGSSVGDVISQLRTNTDIAAARRIVFDLVMGADCEFFVSDLKALSDFFATLPGNPEILWGCSRAPRQSEKLKLNILIIM